MATEGRFLNFVVFVVNTCEALLADRLESSGMAKGFDKLSPKKHPHKFKKPSNMHKNANIL